MKLCQLNEDVFDEGFLKKAALGGLASLALASGTGEQKQNISQDNIKPTTHQQSTKSEASVKNYANKQEMLDDVKNTPSDKRHIFAAYLSSMKFLAANNMLSSKNIVNVLSHMEALQDVDSDIIAQLIADIEKYTGDNVGRKGAMAIRNLSSLDYARLVHHQTEDKIEQATGETGIGSIHLKKDGYHHFMSNTGSHKVKIEPVY